MELRELQYFREVARQRHFTRAADALYVSQPSVSRHIRQLERELGAELFDRAGNHVELTEAGKRFLVYVERALAELEQGRDAVAEASGSDVDRIAMSGVQTLNSTLIAEILARYKRRHPRVSMAITGVGTHSVERVLKGELDLAIQAIYGPLDAAVDADPLFREELVAVVPRTHRLADRSRVTLADLAGEPLASAKAGYGHRRAIDAAFEAQALRPHVVIEIDQTDALVGLARAAMCVSIVPVLAVTPADLRSLAALPLDPPIYRHILLVTRRGWPVRRSVRELMATAKEVVADMGLAAGATADALLGADGSPSPGPPGERRPNGDTPD